MLSILIWLWILTIVCKILVHLLGAIVPRSDRNDTFDPSDTFDRQPPK